MFGVLFFILYWVVWAILLNNGVKSNDADELKLALLLSPLCIGSLISVVFAEIGNFLERKFSKEEKYHDNNEDKFDTRSY